MRKALGSKPGTPTKKGTWGGSYQIDYGNYESHVSCYTCVNCVDESKSCRKHGMFIPVLGKNHWRICPYFMLKIEYADTNNSEFVRCIKGNGFIQQEITINEKSSNKITSTSKKKTSTITKKISIPKNIIENVVMLCIQELKSPIEIFKLASKRTKKDSYKSIRYDSIILESLKKTIKADGKEFGTISYFIYEISNELNCSMLKILNLSIDEKKKIAHDFMNSDKYYDQKDSRGVNQYILLPDNKTYGEYQKYCYEKNIEFGENCYKLPFYDNDIDDCITDRNGQLLEEDYKMIIFFDFSMFTEISDNFDLNYSFPIYFHREYMKYKKNDDCSKCGTKFEYEYVNQEKDNEWICPKCHAKNSIYENYKFLEAYMPKK